MKKILLCFLLIAAALIAQAQEPKATKQQTIEYIVNTLLNYSSDFEYQNSGSVWVHNGTLSIKEISLNDCSLNIKVNRRENAYKNGEKEGATEDYTNVLLIKMNEIENIKGSNSETWKSNIIFYCFNSKKLIKYHHGYDEKQEDVSSISFPAPMMKNLLKPSITFANYVVHQSQLNFNN